MQTSLNSYDQEQEFLEKNKKNDDIYADKEVVSVSDKFRYGQYFTKVKIVKRVLKLIRDYKTYSKDINILEPSSGTGNFIKVLKDEGFISIDECEIDPQLTSNPKDFFEFPLENKYDLIIGNPPFTKYNVIESYYYPRRYVSSSILPENYLTQKILKKNKEKIENVFILKSLKHLRDYNSTIAFVLPISFFIKNRNKEVKEKIIKKFNTIIIFQNDEVWFDYHIPCCFAIFTNTEKFKNKIIITFENSEEHKKIMGLKDIHEELIPEIFFKKTNGYADNSIGIPLDNFLSNEKIKFNKSFKNNNVSARNILERKNIPENSDYFDYKLAIARVGNASVGRAGLINIKTDILNDMFYVFDFKKEYQNNKKIKEEICEEINKRQDYFKNITCRVGSKSIKKENVLSFKIDLAS